MASRNDASDLANIIAIPDGVDPQVFLDMADLQVTEKLSTAGMTSARLRLIELWLAGHYAAIVEEGGGLIRQKMGNSEDWWSDIYGAGIQSTRFGQTACSFDSSGILAKSLSGKGRAELKFVGTRVLPT